MHALSTVREDCGMDDLVQWLGEQLDIDAEHAQEAAAALGGYWSAQSLQSGRRKPRHYVGASTEAHISHSNSEILSGSEAVVRHATVHDPARVLREIDAKRRMLDRHAPHSMGGCRVCEAPHWGVLVCNHCYGNAWPCPDVLDVVALYADQPGYREEWRP